MRNPCLFSLTAILISLSATSAQEREFYKKPTNVPEFWKALQFELAVGKYEIAAGHIKGLLAANPTDKELLEIESKDGLVAFLRLRNIESWAPDRGSDRDARQDVEKLIGLVSTALKKELSNPDRIAKFAKNLNAPTPEESTYAMKELLRSGLDAMPILLGIAEGATDTRVRGSILALLPSFDASAVPPVIAELELKEPKFKSDLLDSLVQRKDFLALPGHVETDPIPILWYTAAPLPQNPESIRKKSLMLLQGLLGRDPLNVKEEEKSLAQWQLTELARNFYAHKVKFVGKERVTVWKTQGNQLVAEEKSILEAEEYYGMRCLHWALEIQPDYLPAQKLFIQFALERHFLRVGIDAPLAKSSPALSAILATARYDMLNDLLETALREDRVGVALVVIQALADRAELKASKPTERTNVTPNSPERVLRPALLMKALDYPDRRIQFAAAIAILRMPGNPSHQRTSQIVRILSGAVATDPDEKESKPKAMIGDSDKIRALATAQMLRRAGYDVDTASTGKDVILQMQKRGDYDLLMVDYRLPFPQFPEFLAQARADIRIGTVPMIVVASGPQTPIAHPTTLLARIAVIVAATEQDDEKRVRSVGDVDTVRDAPVRRFNNRLDRIKKLVESVGIKATPDVLDRLEYYSLLAVPAGEIELDTDVSGGRLLLPPDNRRSRLAMLKAKVAPTEPQFYDLKLLTPKLADLVASLEVAQPPNQKITTNAIWAVVSGGSLDKTGRWLQEPLPPMVVRYPEIEGKINYLLRGYKQVKAIPEVFSDQSLREELQGFIYYQDAKVLDTLRRANAVEAMTWFRKMAFGEVVGYPFAEAETVIRKALRSKDLAPIAIDVVSKLASREAQQDLASVVLNTGDDATPENRIRAAGALINHIQLRGVMLSMPQLQVLRELASVEANPELQSKLVLLQGIFAADAKSTGAKLLQYAPAPQSPPKEVEKKE